MRKLNSTVPNVITVLNSVSELLDQVIDARVSPIGGSHTDVIPVTIRDFDCRVTNLIIGEDIIINDGVSTLTFTNGIEDLFSLTVQFYGSIRADKYTTRL